MGKFEKDREKVLAILQKDTVTHSDRMDLLKIYQVPYHDTGKIETMYSLDSSCNHCEYCQKIRKAGKDNPLVICNYCYDNEQEKRWINVANRHGLQMLIMSEVDFTTDELKSLRIDFVARFNSSGDVRNVTMARNYIRIMYAHPLVFFGLFAKNTLPVVIATDELGKPSNCKYIQSSPIIGGKLPRLAPYFDVQFVVFPDEQSTEKAIADGAMECNGKKCKDCGYKCYLPEENGGWASGTTIAEVLRLKNKENMAKVLKAYYEQ